MKSIKLSNGFAFKVEENVIDDMELVDAIAEMTDEENALSISKVASRLFGKNKKAIYESLRENGTVSVTSVANAITETFNQLGESAKK